MYSRKRTSQNSFSNFISIFPKSFMIFCQALQDPKRNYENQIWTWAPKHVIMKKTQHSGFELWTPANFTSILSLGHQSRYQNLPHINISSIQNYQGLILAGHFYWFGRFVPSTGIFRSTALWEHYVSGFDGAMPKYLQLLQVCWVRILGVNFNIFSCWHFWETRFKSGFHSSFWYFISGIWKWGMARSFWNHGIQISIRQVHFQEYIFPAVNSKNWKHLLLITKYLLLRNSCVSSVWILIFDTD
jgi:hypothetical protein